MSHYLNDILRILHSSVLLTARSWPAIICRLFEYVLQEKDVKEVNVKEEGVKEANVKGDNVKEEGVKEM